MLTLKKGIIKMESLNVKINKKLIIFIASILSLLVILFINLTPSHKNISALNKISSQIQNCTKDFDDLLNSDGIDMEKTIDALSNNNIKLDSIKTSLNDIQITNDDSNIKDELIANLDYNTSLNNLCLTLLKNPQAEDFTVKYNDYSNTYNLLLDNYSSLNSLGINIKFPDSAKNFFDYNSKYFSTLINLNRDKDIKVLQRNNYIASLKDCIEAFDKIDEDLEPALNKIREENRSFDNLLKDVRDKKSTLNEIKNTSYCISIPENGNECFNLLQDTINYYELYITSLEHSIVIEKTSNIEDNKKNIKENYENSFSKFSDFQESLKNLRRELDSFNNK